jgi:hypothetical protein
MFLDLTTVYRKNREKWNTSNNSTGMHSAKSKTNRWAWCFIPVIPAFKRLRQEDPESETRLAYVVSPCLKKTK